MKVKNPAFFKASTLIKHEKQMLVVMNNTHTVMQTKNLSCINHLTPSKLVFTRKRAFLNCKVSLLSKNSILDVPKSLLSNLSKTCIAT